MFIDCSVKSAELVFTHFRGKNPTFDLYAQVETKSGYIFTALSVFYQNFLFSVSAFVMISYTLSLVKKSTISSMHMLRNVLLKHNCCNFQISEIQ